MRNYTFVGKGQVFIALKGGQLRPIGNCDKVSLGFEEEVVELKDFQHQGGGLANSLSRISKASLSLNLFEFSPENIALATFGDTKNVASSSVLNEKHVIKHDGYIHLDKPFVSNVVVENTADVTVYQEGQDYQIRSGSIYIPSTSTIPESTEVDISYDYGDSDVIEMLVTTGKEYSIYFEGLNEARSGKRSTLEIYRAKFNPASSIEMIGSEFASIELNANVLNDPNRTGDGVSSFMKMIVEA